MKRFFLAASAFLLLALVMVTSGPAQVVTADTNLIQNPGFEGDYSSWLIQFGTAQVAANWTPYWVNDDSKNPVWAMPEWKPAEGQFHPSRVYEGARAQQYFSFYKSHYAGMYQQVQNVTPGQTYRFSIYAQVWSSTSDQERPSVNAGNPNFRIGVDPTGAAAPGPTSGTPSTVVWTDIAPMGAIIDNWHQMTIDVKAESSTITVYINSNPQWAVKHNDIYIDAANLIAVGSPAPVVATPAPTSPDTGSGGSGCVIPASGPWPPCATGGGGGTTSGTAGCTIPASGPWPPCATGGSGTAIPGNPNCVIPASGPWPPCATTGGGGSTAPSNDGCVIPASGPWPPCATGGGGGTTGGGGGDTTPAATATPAPVVSTASTGTFKLGGQTHGLGHPQVMLDAGLNWVKFQHKWGVDNNPSDLQGRIADAKAQGFKVLMSIPGSDHSNINFSAYAAYLGGVAGLNPAPDAIEVWNEMNIDREWPTGQISGASYTNSMLKPAYRAIKAANSSVMVISGAPAPTGFFGGVCTPQGCDDAPYIREMIANGAADFMDCLGIHYNEGIIPPSQTSGDPRGNSSHYTRYFWGMTDTYWEAIGGRKPLCYTELGYLSGADYGGVPAGFSWAGRHIYCRTCAMAW